MSDNELVLRIPHTLGVAEARKRIESGVVAASTQFGTYLKTSEVEWEGDRLKFRLAALAQIIRGTVDVASDHVELRAELPLLIRMLAKRFVPIVQQSGQKLLAGKR